MAAETRAHAMDRRSIASRSPAATSLPANSSARSSSESHLTPSVRDRTAPPPLGSELNRPRTVVRQALHLRSLIPADSCQYQRTHIPPDNTPYTRPFIVPGVSRAPDGI